MKSSYIVIIISIIILVVIYLLFFRKLYFSPFKVIHDTHNYDKLMVVVHPDDELIFGGRELLSGHGWKVVCITCGTLLSNNKLKFYSTNIRRKEFERVMDKLNCSYEIWDYEDSLTNDRWNEEALEKDLARIINEQIYRKIVTHNLDGEYGHIQHKKISRMIHHLKPKNLYVFGCDSSQINPCLDEVYSLLKLYSSQKETIKKYHRYVVHQKIFPVSFNYVC